MKIEQHFLNDFKYYCVVILLFVAGILAGTLTNLCIGESEKRQISDFVLGFLNSAHGNSKNLDLLKVSAFGNIKLMAAIWILGASVLGFPLLICIAAYSGFSLGFCTSFFISKFSVKGFLFVLMTIFPQNIVKIPCIIAACVIGLKFSLKILDSFIINKNKGNLDPPIQIGHYSFMYIVFSFILCITSFYDAYIVPLLLKTPMFKF